MLGFRQAIFPAGEFVSDWVADVKKGLNSLYVYCVMSQRIVRTVIHGTVTRQSQLKHDSS
jgi:hypothetical protein